MKGSKEDIAAQIQLLNEQILEEKEKKQADFADTGGIREFSPLGQCSLILKFKNILISVIYYNIE